MLAPNINIRVAKRRRWMLPAALLLLLVMLVPALSVRQSASDLPAIPFPNPLVLVTTQSGSVIRETPVPIGGVPVPIDVDNGRISGLLQPDIDVAIPVVALEELEHGNLIVPQIVVRRHFLAPIRRAPAPDLRVAVRVSVTNATDNFSELATITYGFKTPGGSRMPPIVRAKLTGPIESGFTDPLTGSIESPGYNGPLNFDVHAHTPTLDARFKLNFDPLPEKINFVQDPTDDGLKFSYDHSGAVPDVDLDAGFTLTQLPKRDKLQIGARIERVPHHLNLSYAARGGQTFFDYASGTSQRKPDISATYSDTLGDGTVNTDADIKLSGLPARLAGRLDQDPAGGLTGVDFKVLDGEQIDAIDFLARNWTGDPGPVPEPNLGPEQFVAVHTRPLPDGSSRYRAAGRIQGVRGATYKKVGDGLDVTTDIGDGVRPLRAILDVDDRVPGATLPPEAKRMKVDTTVSPLPRQIHARYEPAAGGGPTKIHYDANQSVDIAADALIAEGDKDGCGQAEVTCATATVDKLPPELDIHLPGAGGTDVLLHHDGSPTNGPDVRAKLDLTPKDDPLTPENEAVSGRNYIEAGLLRIPREIRGRLDTQSGVLRKAEFHGCTFDFDANACDDTQGAIGRVTFTVRDRPDRSGLPPRPDTAPTFVTMLKRDARQEIMGRVDEVRNVVFHQRDEDSDGVADGTLGALIDAGAGGPFDAKIDQVDGTKSTKIDVGVESLPTLFSACVRQAKETEPADPDDLTPDPLLQDCDRTDVLGRQEGDLESTPMSIVYRSSAATEVSARVDGVGPNADDGDRTSTDHFGATIANVPSGGVEPDGSIDPQSTPAIRADVISPKSPANGDPSRKLELGYRANDPITRIDFDMETRRSNSFCADPRPERKALCMSATIKNLPENITATYDPDEENGDIDFQAPPGPGNARLSIDPLDLSLVSPEAGSTPLVAHAEITNISDHVEAKIQKKDLDGEDPAGLANLSTADRLATCSDGDDDDGDGKTDADDPDCARELAQIAFDACPDPGACDGIGRIVFRASNALVGDPVPAVPDLNPPLPVGDTPQAFSYVQRGDDFRAQGSINNLKELRYSRVDDDENVLASTLMRAAFGSGLASEKVRAYIDTDDGASKTLLDALVKEAPSAINICLRESVRDADESSPIWCERQDDEFTAIQARLDSASSARPDIEVRDLLLSKGGGTDVLTGGDGAGHAAVIEDLAQRIDVLSGPDGQLLLEGHNANDPDGATPVNAAGRVTVDLRNFATAPGSNATFPFAPIESTYTDPASDSRNDDPATYDHDGSSSTANVTTPNQGRNYARYMTQDSRFLIRASIPAIEKVQTRPGACRQDANGDSTDPRFPDPEDYVDEADRPSYDCINLVAARNRPLGLALRDLKGTGSAAEITSIDEGHIDSVPNGASGLAITNVSVPETIKEEPACSTFDPDVVSANMPCQPPMMDVQAPQSNDQDSDLQARLATGNRTQLNNLKTITPLDALSSRLDWEQAPKDFGEQGLRVKVGTPDGVGPLIRIGVNIDVPQFLTIDSPVLFDCTHATTNSACLDDASTVGSSKNTGYKTGDTFFKVVAANTDPKDAGTNPSYVSSLGRVALFVDPMKADNSGDQIILSGAPAADGKTWFDTCPGPAGDNDPACNSSRTTTGASQYNPESFPPTSDVSNFGFAAPGHLDVRMYTRNDYAAVVDDENSYQQEFTQLDGRLSHPLSMAVRLVKKDETDDDGVVHYYNRAGSRIANTNISPRNLPGIGGTHDANSFYSKPTFRVRAELRNKATDDSTDDNGPLFAQVRPKGACRQNGAIGYEVPSLSTFCIYTPANSTTEWLDIGLNAKPTSADAARTVDALAWLSKSNQVDLRAFADIDGTGGTLSKGSTAEFTPQAALRLSNFEIGAKMGFGIILVGGSGELITVSDVILGFAGKLNRMRLSHKDAQIRLKSDSSTNPAKFQSHVITVTKIVERFEAFFGLIEEETRNFESGQYRQRVQMWDCEAFIPGIESIPGPSHLDQKSSNADDDDDEETQIRGTIAFDPDDAEDQGASEFFSTLMDILPLAFCGSDVTSDSELVDASHPAPRYTRTANPVGDNGITVPPPSNQCSDGVDNDGDGKIDFGSGGSNEPASDCTSPDDNSEASPLPPNNEDITPPDVTISSPIALCGLIEVGTLTVNAAVTVKTSGNVVDPATGNAKLYATGPNAGQPIPCDDPNTAESEAGNLTIDAENVVIGSGGSISATGIMSPNGPGFPASGSGGGAGHNGSGGTGGSGSGTVGAGGGAYNAPSGTPLSVTNPSLDYGSRGRGGSDGGATGGSGGGTVRVVATNNITVNGSLQARGANGATPSSNGSDSCAPIGGGGGSGGHISLSALRLLGSGSIDARGGDGGAANGKGGGGGSGGRITQNAVRREVTTLVGGGTGGDSGGSGDDICHINPDPDGSDPLPDPPDDDSFDGQNGGNGRSDLGQQLSRAAEVTLHPDNDDFWANDDSVKLNVKGIQGSPSAGGQMNIIVCWQRLDGSTQPFDHDSNANTAPIQPLDRDSLNPNPDSSNDAFASAALAASNNCVSRRFANHNSGSDSYTGTIEFDSPDPGTGSTEAPTLTDGYYGFYAMAARDSGGPANDCVRSSSETQNCNFQEVPPHRSTARIGVDGSAPTASSFQQLNGGADGSCATTSPASNARCLTESVTRFQFSASERLSGASFESGSGLASTQCFLANAAGTEITGSRQSCTPGSPTTLTVPAGDGLKTVKVVLTDAVGNASSAFTVGSWFIDRTAPNNPTLTLTNNGTQKNGWFTQTPSISVSATDPNPSAGFSAGGITLYTDSAAKTCGAAATRNAGTTGTTSTSCSVADVNALSAIPDEGIHDFTAEATDALGNISGLSDCDLGTPGSQPCKMKVDKTPPVSRLFLGPSKPDGTGTWYRTRPFFAFASSDKAGGSGVNPALDTDDVGTGVWYRVFESLTAANAVTANKTNYTEWDPSPSADETNRLPDGTKVLCWFAIDVAGNQESKKCSDTVSQDFDKTNTNAVDDEIRVDSQIPVALDPIVPANPNGQSSFYTSTPTVTPAGSDGGSGVQRVEYQVDGGGWTAAAPFTIAEGRHEVRTRAFDNAGNQSDTKERVVFVDLKKPNASSGTYPPEPNEQGWFRQTPTVSIAAFDGRDSSGVDTASYKIDANPFANYLRPFTIADGAHSFQVRARDHAGNQSDPDSSALKVDQTAPVARAIGIPKPILLFNSTVLEGNVTDALGSRIKARVMIYNTVGELVRQLPINGPHPGGYSTEGRVKVKWDGRDARGRGAFPGIYYHRVQATDEAGNTVTSSEGQTFLVILGVLPR